MKYTIVAEAGISHNGNIDYARKSIEVAKECGADIWKTQLYKPESLFPNHKVIVQDRNWYPEVEKTELSFEQVSMLKNHCDKVGIEFMASAFDTKRLQWLELLHVKRHKIASPMNTNKEYIEKVLLTGKEVIISFGSKDTARTFSNEKYNQVSQIYCVSRYPTKLSDINLDELLSFVGFSDHTQGIEASVFAMANSTDVEGGYFIEKHFKLSDSDVGPDMIVSIIPSELRCLVNFARKFEEIN